jgi:ubiquitin-conjugating enzyme E2 variant
VSSLLLAVLALRIAERLAAEGGWWLVVLGLPVGYLCADALSGSVHWFCDRFFAEDTPVLGRVVIAPFRDHHRHPRRITAYGFLHQDTSSFFLMLPPLLFAWFRDLPLGAGAVSLFACSALFALALGSFGTNLFHKWAHARSVPPGVRTLQRLGLILRPSGHRVHHRDHRRSFCVTSGWLNGVLDATGVLLGIEVLVRASQRRLGRSPVVRRDEEGSAG